MTKILRVLFSWPVLALIALVAGWLIYRMPSPQPTLPTIQIAIDGRPIIAEQATTLYSRAHGMMGRTSLPEGRGMLFSYPDEAPRKFWMKNTLIPLDILFFSKDPTSPEWIMTSWHAAVPCKDDPCPRYGNEDPIIHVVELPGGTVKGRGWGVGARLVLPDERLVPAE